MNNKNAMCATLELGISGDSHDLIRNVCEDNGVIAVDKDTMSIILDVYDDVVQTLPKVGLRISTEEIELEVEGTGENAVLFGLIKCGETASDINQLIDEFSVNHGEEDDEGLEEDDEEAWGADDYLSFVIAVGEIDKSTLPKIQGVLNTHLSTRPLKFDEGALVNMTVARLGDFHID